MAWMWLGPDTLQEAAMGDFYPNPDGTWRYDEDAPTPGWNSPPTYMLPVVGPIGYGGHQDWPGPTPEPPAVTAGEQDHSDISVFVGPSAEAPVNP